MMAVGAEYKYIWITIYQGNKHYVDVMSMILIRSVCIWEAFTTMLKIYLN